MKVLHTSKQELMETLAEINKEFDNNVMFDRFPESTVPTKNGFNFTLRVIDSRAKGSRISSSGRRMAKACWHVHGEFFDTLIENNQDAIVKTGYYGSSDIDKNGGNWKDRNIGSQYQPMYYSEACDCDN